MIVQGTTATLYFLVADDQNSTVDLTGATVSIVFQLPDSDRTFEKPSEIINSQTGRCKVCLTPADLSESGTYSFQLVVKKTDASVSKSLVTQFFVAESLEGELNG